MCLLLFILFRKKLTFPPLLSLALPFRGAPQDAVHRPAFRGRTAFLQPSQVVITYFVNMLGNEALRRTYLRR